MDQIEQTVAETKEVLSIDKLLSDPEAKKLILSYADSRVTEGIKTFKEQGFATAVEKEVEQRLNAKTNKSPEQIRLEEAEAKLNKVLTDLANKERSEMKLKNKDVARSILKDASVPEDVLDFLVSEDSEKTKDNATKMLEIFTNFKTSIVQNGITNNNVRVPNSSKNLGNNNGEPSENASKEEWLAYYRNKK